MTVCIAAILPNPRATIVFVSDTLGTGDFTSMEGLTKYQALDEDGNWVVMHSATDVRRITPILRDVKRELGSRGRKSVEEVEAACVEAYRVGIERIADAKLSSRGLTRKLLLEICRERHAENGLFERILDNEIKGIDLATTLLVAGFDDSKVARLFEVTPSGEILHQPSDVHAIGEGAWVVLSLLNSVPHYWTYSDLHSNIYRLCAAKFAAEQVRSVGPETSVTTLTSDGELRFMLPTRVEKLRLIWTKQSLTKAPPRAINLISHNLVTVKELFGELPGK